MLVRPQLDARRRADADGVLPNAVAAVRAAAEAGTAPAALSRLAETVDRGLGASGPAPQCPTGLAQPYPAWARQA